MLNDRQKETLLILQEECAETIQAISKVFRFGWDNYKPGNMKTNKEHLEEELGDLMCMIDLLVGMDLLDAKHINDSIGAKKEKLKIYSNIFKDEPNAG